MLRLPCLTVAAALFALFGAAPDCCLAAKPNIGQLQRQLQRQARNQPQQVVKISLTDYDLYLADEGLVRSMQVLNPELDDKGKPKKLTPAEKEKLRGDSAAERKFVGYKAEAEDLQPGDIVSITLSQYRPVKAKTPVRSLDKSKDKDADDEKTKSKDKDADAEKTKSKDKDADAEKTKSKDKDADAEKTKSKDADADKSKDADKEKPKDEAVKESEEKVAKLKNWKAYNVVNGVLVKVDAGTRRLTIRVQSQQTVMVPPNQVNQINNNNKNPKPTRSSIDASSLQATVVVIVQRGQAPKK